MNHNWLIIATTLDDCMFKKTTLFIITIFSVLCFLSGCAEDRYSSKDSEQENNSALVGKWRLFTVNGIDYSSLNIEIVHNQDTYSFVSPDCIENGNYTTWNNIITYNSTDVSGAGSICDPVGSSVKMSYSVTSTTLTKMQENQVELVYTRF